ncbi:MAG: aldose 1-epimerase [Rhodobacteraceae bacterium]|nr:aldose 1-epimerase [Paracoccaceae bacterium]
MIPLSAGAAEALVAPDMGGGLAALTVSGRPVLRGWSGRAEEGPFALGLNLLAPFSNRIAGGFDFDGRRYDLAPNLPGEPFPIHGDAFQRAWKVAARSGWSVTLALPEGEFGPFRYAAEVVYRLAPGDIAIALRLTSRARDPLPFGGGFHPWFPRSAATRLRFDAAGHWPEDARHLPASETPEPEPAGWRWSEPAPLPAGWINAGFSDWNGAAEIHQGPDAVSVRVSARDLTTIILYAPSSEAGFFCLEPVSHPVNAHNLPGKPGLSTLQPGESLSWSLHLKWSEP